MPGALQESFLFLTFSLAGTVARSGGHGKNLHPVGIRKLLIASCPPLSPSWASSDVRL